MVGVVGATVNVVLGASTKFVAGLMTGLEIVIGPVAGGVSSSALGGMRV